MEDPTVHLLGVASGIGAGNQGCSLGPIVLQEDTELLADLPVHWVWENMIYPPEGQYSRLGALAAVADLSHRLAYEVNDFIHNQQKFAVIGGDHSIGVGTWSGLAYALRKQGNIGLIWFDAHLDSHTPSTTETGNVHGMPVAHLLGYGETALCSILDAEPKILPENLCFVGIRSYEKGEHDLLKKLNVKIFYMEEVEQKGIEAVMKEAIDHVSKNTVGYGVSIDLDGLDPTEAPGVGTPVAGGINAKDFIASLGQLRNDSKMLGVEIVEFNPKQDKDNKTKKVIKDILKTLFIGK
ncbi:MAG: rocF [Gammaproteobacteria bacterium]|jgi:arginase|nr:rocF [Gammaproteobacteria bacterium]